MKRAMLTHPAKLRLINAGFWAVNAGMESNEPAKP
jgi:hypothetical protein